MYTYSFNEYYRSLNVAFSDTHTYTHSLGSVAQAVVERHHKQRANNGLVTDGEPSLLLHGVDESQQHLLVQEEVMEVAQSSLHCCLPWELCMRGGVMRADGEI